MIHQWTSALDKRLFRGGREEAFGVHLRLSKKGTLSIRWVKLMEKGGDVSIVDRGAPGSFEELKGRVGNAPMSLCITGSGVVTKALATEGDAPVEQRIKEVLPSAKADSFYFQSYDGDHFHVGTVGRKDRIGPILDDLASNDLHPLALFLGSASFLPYTPFLDTPPERLQLEDIEIELENGEPKGIDKREDGEEGREDRTYSIGGEIFHQEDIEALSAGLSYLTAPSSLQAPSDGILSDNLDEEAQKRTFRVAGAASLTLFFLLLLGNFLYFQHARGELRRLEDRAASERADLERLKALKKEVERKEGIIGASGLQERTEPAFLADRIASAIPEELTLTTLSIAPMEEKVREGERIDLHKDRVLIRGMTPKGEHLNQWIASLKERGFVREVTVRDYARDERERRASFFLELELGRT